MAAKMPGLNYSCEICGADGLSDEEMRVHIVMCHLKGAASCPFCDLEDVTADEMLTHVNTAHLDYLTPEQELLTFIDDDVDSERHEHMSNWSISMKPHNGLPNNINNNNNSYCDLKSLEKEGASGWSPRRSQLALNLSSSSSSSLMTPGLQKCPMCSYSNENTSQLEEHINRQHFDLTSPSFPVDTPSGSFSCPLCAQNFFNASDLELHVNIEHKDILSPGKVSSDISVEKATEMCPICCMTNFKSTEDLGAHIEDHFNQKVMSPLSPDVSCDRMLAREMEKRDKEMRRLREQHEFELLRAQYGMDNEGNFREQSLTNMQRAVYSGELSVADYYERQIELRMAESSGVDDSSSCSKDIVPQVYAISSGCPNVAHTLMCTTVDHYASTYGDKGWGCGYRNMQMMLSSLLHHTGYNEQLYKQWAVAGAVRGEMPSRSAMPSISRLQHHIEWAWHQGFDLQGCDQLGGKLSNTRKWIGATEVVTVLSSLRIRCQLVDFHRPTSANGSHPELFNWVRQYFEAHDDFKPPLYLQHQGHSRTIIGVEVLRDETVILLVLDPSHTPQQMSELRATNTAVSAMRLIRRSLANMKARHYQVVAVCGIMDTDTEYQGEKMFKVNYYQGADGKSQERKRQSQQEVQ